MKGVVITTDNQVSVKEFSRPLYKAVKEILGGYMEHVRPRGLKAPYCFLCNEEGLIYGLPENAYGSFLYGKQYHGSPIVGNIIVMKDGWTEEGPDIVGLSDEEATRISQDATDWIKRHQRG